MNCPSRKLKATLLIFELQTWGKAGLRLNGTRMGRSDRGMELCLFVGGGQIAGVLRHPSIHGT